MNPGSSTQADDYSPSAPSEGIIGGLNFRKSLHAEGVDLSDPVLEGDSLDPHPLRRDSGGGIQDRVEAYIT